MAQLPPGLVRAKMNPEVMMMVCTAGHVDHGKTSLVKLLTGCSTDRLKEEQERQLTIELGFAPCLIGPGLSIGIVDVPGHEKFVKNMVAGVSGIDMTVLVIAADDGVMPQTIEHFQIMDLLGVRHGMVALTKIDRVPAERIEVVTREIREFLKGTFMDQAKICPVSSETFDGYGEFYDTLVAEVQSLKKRRSHGVFRMPVLNVFARAGFGTVVTGIPVDGTIEIGQQVEVVPGHRTGRVRGLQRFLRNAAEGGFGQCLAINISEFGKIPPERGHVVCLPGYLQTWRSFHLRLTAVPGIDRPLKNAEQVKFHTGTVEVPGKLYLLEGKTLEEGQTGLANIALAEPVAAAVHDKFIIRRTSPAVTVAGGAIIGTSEALRREPRKVAVERLQAFLDTFEGAAATGPDRHEREIEYFLRSERPTGATFLEIMRGTLLAREAALDCVGRLENHRRILKLTPDHHIHLDSYRAYKQVAAARVDEFAAKANTLSINVSDLRQGLDWPQVLWSRILEDLEKERKITRRGDKIVLESAASDLSPQDEKLVTRILGVFDGMGFKSPRPDELPTRLKAPPADVERLLDYLFAREKLYRLNKNVVLSHSWLRKAQDLVVAAIHEKGILDSAEFKYHIDSTRKYALAILDYFDARKLTVRRGNDRRLAADYERYMV